MHESLGPYMPRATNRGSIKLHRSVPEQLDQLSDRAFRVHITMLTRCQIGGIAHTVERFDILRGCGIGDRSEQTDVIDELVAAGVWRESRLPSEWEMVVGVGRQPGDDPRDMPNNGLGWFGKAPLPRTSNAPAVGVPVVYHLYTRDGLVYIGSTAKFRSRLSEHVRDGKTFSRWSAEEYETRHAALFEEKRRVRLLKPPLNTTWVDDPLPSDQRAPWNWSPVNGWTGDQYELPPWSRRSKKAASEHHQRCHDHAPGRLLLPGMSRL